KKLTGRYAAGSVLAKLYDLFLSTNDSDIEELAKLTSKDNTILGALSTLEPDQNIGKELGSWIISRRGHKIRIVIKATKPMRQDHAKRRSGSQTCTHHRRNSRVVFSKRSQSKPDSSNAVTGELQAGTTAETN